MRSIYAFFLGFLFNSFLVRAVGKVPDDDILFPAFLFVLFSVTFILSGQKQ